MFVLLTGILCFLCFTARSQSTDLVNSSYGIWQTFGDPVTLATTPELHGRLCNFRWADIEPAPNTWDWTQFDSDLAARAADSLPIIFMVYTEEDAPEWIYSNGVPKVAMKDPRGNIVGYAPYYADQDYKDYFERMISTVRAHIDSLPNYVRTHIVAVQACLGSTGDYIGYKGDVDPQYFLSGNDFYSLFKEFSQYYYDEYKTTNPKIYLLSNPKNNGPDQINWLISNCPNSWIKTGTLGKGYQLNDEIAKSDWLFPILNNKLSWGDYMRSRSEIIGGGLSSGWWNSCPYRNMFTMFCYDIFWGLDWSNQGYDQLNDSKYDSAFGFYNKYAGQKDPGTSNNAMCALRDGLNAADVVRFPESIYGTADRNNTDRYLKIQQDYAAFGAKLDDPTTATLTELDNLGARGINDVGWDVFPGNYDRYLHQIDPNGNSVGYWNVQTADKDDMYGRFARGFDNANGKNTLYFDVDSAFLNNAPLNGKNAVMIDIVYLDKPNCGFKLIYDGVSNSNAVALSVTCGNSNLWKRASITINDAYFGNRAANGSDFYIQNTSDSNDVFAIVELSRAQSAQQIGIAASSLNPFDTICTTSSEYQNLFLNGNFLDGATVILGPLPGFSFSMDNGRTYPDSLVISDYGASFGEKIFVKFSPKTAGSYNGTIPLKYGNNSLSGIPVNANATDGPILSANISNISCNGLKDGGIDLNASSGTETFAYYWTGPSNYKANTQDITNLSAGTYTVSVTARSGCRSTGTFTVSEPIGLVESLSADQMTCKDGTTKLYVNGIGGTQPYTGIGTFSVNAGTYNYTITDARGCVATNSITVANGSKLPPQQPVSINSSDADSEGLCGGGSFNYSVATVSQATSYTWAFPGGSTISLSNSDSSQITVNIPTNFKGGTLSVTANNSCGSSVALTKLMSVLPPDVNSIMGATSVSANQISIEYKANPIIAGATYVWTVPADARIESGQNTPDIFVTWGSNPGNVTVQTVNNCGSSKQISLPVNLISRPNLTASSLPSFGNVCIGTSSTGSFNLSGNTLNGSDITIGPLSGYTFSTSQTGLYSSTLILSGYGSAINQTVYIKFSPSSTKSYNGNINIAGGGVATFAVQTTATGVGAPTLSSSASDLSCNAANDGAINLVVNGGTAPFTFDWTNNSGNFHATTEDLVGLPADSYKVTVTSGGGCTASTTATVNQPPALIVTANAGNVGSNDSALVSVSASGGISPYLGTGTFSVAQGTYTYSVTDAAGCTSHTTVTVAAVREPLNVIATAGSILCNGGTTTVEVTATGGLAPYSGTGTFLATAGNHSYTVTDASGQQKSIIINIAEPSALVVNAAVNSMGANDTALVSISASGGTSPYLGTGVFSVPQGTYTYSVIDAAGCTANTSITVNALTPALNATASTGRILCNGGTTNIEISATGGVAPYTGTGTFEVSAGTYTYTVKDAKGEQSSVTVTVGQPSALIANVQAGNISANDSTTVMVTATGGTAPYIGTGNFNVAQGTYTYIVSDAAGCSANASVTISATRPSLQANVIAGKILCNGGTTTIDVSATGGTEPYMGTGHFVVVAGTYTYIVTDANGLQSSVNVVIPQPAPLTIESITNSSVSACKNADGSLIVNVTGGTEPYLYNLNGGHYQNSSNFTGLSNGNYTAIVKDNNGCLTSATTNIIKYETFTAKLSEINDVSSCGTNDGSFTVSTSGGSAPFIYTIDNGENTQTNNVFEHLTSGKYTVAITDSHGCGTTVSTEIKNTPQLSLKVKSKEYASACYNNDGSVSLETSGGTAPFQYSADGINFSSQNTLSGLSAGNYTAMVKDARGCTANVATKIIAASPLTISLKDVDFVSACSNNDGAIVVGKTGGTAPFEYNINGGEYSSDNSFSNLSSGIYSVSVKDSKGCIASTVATISRFAPLNVSVTKTDITCKGGKDGALQINCTGGTGNYKYSIRNGWFGTSEVFTDLSAGTYNVIVKDSRNCETSTTVTLEDGTGTCVPNIPQSIMGEDTVAVKTWIKIIAMPNPTPTEFIVKLKGNSTADVQLIVTDILGRNVYQTKGSMSQEFRFGQNFVPGTYILRVVQGDKTRTLKLIKSNG